MNETVNTSYDHWKTTNPQDEELGSCPQPRQDDEPDQPFDDDEDAVQACQEQCWQDFPPDSDPIPEGSLDTWHTE